MAGGRVDGEGREGEGIEPWHKVLSVQNLSLGAL